MAKRGDLAAARKQLHSVRPTSEASAVRFFIADADLLREAGKLDEAMKVLDDALAQLPGDNDLLYARSLMAEKLGRIDQSEADLKQILASDPDNVQALNALGYTLADRTTRYKEALGYIQRALELSPDEPAILDSMGWVQYRLGNMEQAINFLRRAYKLDADPEVAAHLGEVLWVSGDRSAANQVWDKALKKDPKSKPLLDTVKRFRK
jgi:tetratricopeptide (TPR) repeat protein